MNIVNQNVGEIRVWRVGEAIHANIPRSVVKEPPVIDHVPTAAAPSKADERELDDLALNILNVFVPPEHGSTGPVAPVKCHRGHCSAFAARYHEAFAHAFVYPLPETGGAIATTAIVAWIEHCSAQPLPAPASKVIGRIGASA
jgi:hypothetical protein